eukprot:31547-Pelagococcus_subviridis.AAC.9
MDDDDDDDAKTSRARSARTTRAMNDRIYEHQSISASHALHASTARDASFEPRNLLLSAPASAKLTRLSATTPIAASTSAHAAWTLLNSRRGIAGIMRLRTAAVGDAAFSFFASSSFSK